MKTIIIFLIATTALVARQEKNSTSVPQVAPDNCATELRAAMNRMHESMAHLPVATNADEDFVRLMIPHHQAAMDMAKTELLYGKDPQIRRLAQEIVTDQQSEIEFMELWLKNNATPAPRQSFSHD